MTKTRPPAPPAGGEVKTEGRPQRQWTADQRYWMRHRARQIGNETYLLQAIRYVMDTMDTRMAERELAGIQVTDDWFLEVLDDTSFHAMAAWYEGRA